MGRFCSRPPEVGGSRLASTGDQCHRTASPRWTPLSRRRSFVDAISHIAIVFHNEGDASAVGRVLSHPLQRLSRSSPSRSARADRRLPSQRHLAHDRAIARAPWRERSSALAAGREQVRRRQSAKL
ncbi:hypothetical protein PsYK624_137230 [Phanerochaete sordida]|uniref:Uncharacterized protein n=1 Tax=Phanerochaete sordida TaxID=48140 RepID=A0A9P3GLG3_9APHY|nr:hypothetical protein PsYK624_137230 [Phanerochaete sordida]